jgi:hypothetical protein
MGKRKGAAPSRAVLRQAAAAADAFKKVLRDGLLFNSFSFEPLYKEALPCERNSRSPAFTVSTSAKHATRLKDRGFRHLDARGTSRSPLDRHGHTLFLSLTIQGARRVCPWNHRSSQETGPTPGHGIRNSLDGQRERIL